MTWANTNNRIVLEPSTSALPEAAVHRSSSVMYFGSSPGMNELQKISLAVARSQAPVLIRGETGAGKEVLARHIHLHSRRADKAFVKLNCAALSLELVENELFGYEGSASTGTFHCRPGVFEVADGGTLFLDEIGDMDFKVQAKLLPVLQDQKLQRVGGKETIQVNVRVVAATHNDLKDLVAGGTFRQDLYYRLNVVNLYIPPLRQRKEDIIALAGVLLRKHAAEWGAEVLPEMTPTLQQALLGHDWPGNVRELENVVRELMVIRDPDVVVRDLMVRSTRQTATTFNKAQLAAEPEQVPVLDQVSRAKRLVETEAILAALNETRWNRKHAAALLKIDYKQFLYKMKKLNIDKKGVGQYARGSDTAPENRDQVSKILASTKDYFGH